MKLYIYDEETMEIIATVSGENNEDCEEKAEALQFDQDYGWTYSDTGLKF